MSAPLPRNVLKIPGKLVKDPTNLDSDYPHGGTELGLVRDMVLNFGVQYDYPMAEEFKAPAAQILAAENPIFACVLRSWDDDMLSALWPNAFVSAFGEVSLRSKVSGSGVTRAGANLTSRGFKLLFSPHAVDYHPFVLAYNAVPMIAETAEMQLSIGKEFGLALMFNLMPDSTGRRWELGQRANLTL